MYEISYQLNSPNCIAEAVEDDLIVINLFSGKYYNMQGAAVHAWHALLNGAKPSQLLNANDWTEAEEQAFRHFLQLLVDESLIVAHARTINTELPLTILINDETSSFKVEVFTDMEEMLKLDPIHDADADIGWPHKQ